MWKTGDTGSGTDAAGASRGFALQFFDNKKPLAVRGAKSVG